MWVTDDIAHTSTEQSKTVSETETLPIFERPEARAISGRYHQQLEKLKKLILVSGNAGSGKTYIGKILTKKLSPCVYMDKDTLTRPMVEELLVLNNSYPHDRETEVYLKKIRPLEYDILMKHARENLELGINVIASAPFIKELNDDSWLPDLKEEMEFEDVEVIVVWIESDENTMKKRIISRNAKRDEWKLKNWQAYVKNIHIESPISESVTINNSENYDTPVLSQIDKHF